MNKEQTTKNALTEIKLVLGEVYWTYSVVYLPVQVKVLDIDKENKKARIEQGWIEFSRLYKSEDECPQR